MENDNIPGPQQSEGSRVDSDMFSELNQSLKNALQLFYGESSPENFGKIVSALGAYGFSSTKMWQTLSAYVRKNPMRAALGAGVIFFAAKGLIHAIEKNPEKRLTYH